MKKIAIIGAGYTGLIAALKLAQAGYSVKVLERGPIVGGLASGFKVEGASLERGYHHLFKSDRYIIAMAKELGISNKLKWYESSVAIYYKGNIYPFVTAVDLLRFKPLSLVNRIRAGLSVLYLQRTNNWKQFRQISAYSWMSKVAGKKVTKVIWEPLLQGKFDKYYDKVSMAWLWARIHIRANSKEKGDSAEKLGYFEGGFQVFTDALISKLKKLGVTIETGVEIQTIKSQYDQKVQVIRADKLEIYDACIATIPSKVFASLIDKNKTVKAAYVKQLNSIDYLGARLLIFSSEQELSPYYWHNINDALLPFLVFINHTKLVGKKQYNNKHIYYIGTYLPHDHKLFNCSDEDLEKIWFPALKTIFTNFNLKKVREKHHFRFANAQHIVDTNYDKKIPTYETPIKNVYLANFSQVYPEDRGTNFAVREGEKIAALLTKDREHIKA